MKIKSKKLAIFASAMTIGLCVPMVPVFADAESFITSQVRVADALVEIDTTYDERVADVDVENEEKTSESEDIISEASDTFTDKAVAVGNVDVYESADETSPVAGILSDKNIAVAEIGNDGWTYVKSGNLEGYVKSAKLCFGTEAEDAAILNGNVKATVKNDNVVAFKDASESESVDSLPAETKLSVVDIDDSHVAVEGDGVKVYVRHSDVDIDPGLATGKTTAEIEAEEAARKAEEERKAAEEAARKAAEEEAARKAEEERKAAEEAARKAAEEEAARKAEEERRAAEEQRAREAQQAAQQAQASSAQVSTGTDTTGWSTGTASAYGGSTDPGCGSITANGSYVSESSMGVAIPLAWGRRDLLGHTVLISYGGKTVTAVINDLGGMGGGSRALDLQPGVFRAFGFSSCNGWGLRTVQYKIL